MDLDFGRDGTLYVLEIDSDSNHARQAGAGEVLEIELDD